MQHEKTEHQIDLNNRFGSPWQWAAALTAGISSGFITFRKLTDDKFHEFLLSTAGIKERYIKLSPEERKALNLADTGRATSNLGTIISDYYTQIEKKIAQGGQGEEIAKLQRENWKAIGSEKTSLRTYGKIFTERAFGFSSTGISGQTTGMVQRFNTFSKESRFSIGARTIAAFSAGVGIVAMIVNQFNTRDKLNELDKAAFDNGTKLDTLLSRPEPLAASNDNAQHRASWKAREEARSHQPAEHGRA
jgi:hypothetical protein